MASSYENLLEQKKVFTEEKNSTPVDLVWGTNMAVVSMFLDTNMTEVTSRHVKTLLSPFLGFLQGCCHEEPSGQRSW